MRIELLMSSGVVVHYDSAEETQRKAVNAMIASGALGIVSARHEFKISEPSA